MGARGRRRRLKHRERRALLHAYTRNVVVWWDQDPDDGIEAARERGLLAITGGGATPMCGGFFEYTWTTRGQRVAEQLLAHGKGRACDDARGWLADYEAILGEQPDHRRRWAEVQP